jgi:hypothetical protein
MGQIHFPPTPFVKDRVTSLHCCLQRGEVLTIDIKVPGYLACTTPGLFNPDLPAAGPVTPILLGPYYAVNHDGTAIIVFYNPAADQVYVQTITIQKNPCTPGHCCT